MKIRKKITLKIEITTTKTGNIIKIESYSNPPMELQDNNQETIKYINEESIKTKNNNLIKIKEIKSQITKVCRELLEENESTETINIVYK